MEHLHNLHICAPHKTRIFFQPRYARFFPHNTHKRINAALNGYWALPFNNPQYITKNGYLQGVL